MRIIFWIIILGFSYGCQQKEIKKEFYENGSLKFEVEFQYGLINGFHKEYYKNGALKTLSYADNGVYRDTVFGYYDNGNLEFVQFKNQDKTDSLYLYDKFKEHLASKGKVVDDQLNGWLHNFDNKGEIILKQEYINLGEDVPYLNQEIYLHKGEIIDSLSGYYSITIQDTIVKDKDVSIAFGYSPIISKDSQVLICFSTDVDDDYANINDVKLDTMVLENFKLNTRIKFNTVGSKSIKGFFNEKYVFYQPVKNDTLVNIITSTKKMYFNVEVFVKDVN